ncbi:hypothetical protein M5K25_024525 [Dendrobium thyrsiflorum]|uniref:DUF4283 domain-containing protein n=1 Tax=Dendrobium thyrsiflorum TaxID=117978 RepID=A0ABD0U2I0_DENTH
MAAGRVRDPGFLDGVPKSRSFREVLSGLPSSSDFPDLVVSSLHGLPALMISEDEMSALLGNFLVGVCLLDAIRNFFFKLKLFGEFSITVLNNKNVLIKLRNDLDYSRVFSHRAYFVGNCFMKLCKWSALFDVSVESPIVPIWVSFPNLWPHLFSPRILHGLGSIFGRPLRLDNATANGSRPSVPRVLVELDITKRYPDRVWLGSDSVGYVQVVEMEEFSSYCVHCKSLGHLKAECHILHPNLKSVSVHVSNKPLEVCGDVSGIPNDDVNVGLTQTNELNPVAQATTGLAPIDQVGSVLTSNVGCLEQLVVVGIAEPVKSPLILNDAQDGAGPSRITTDLLVSNLVGRWPGAVMMLPVNEIGVEGENVAIEAINVIAPIESDVRNVDCSPFEESCGNVELVNVPISIVSAKSVQAHLSSMVGTSIMVDSNWLEITPNSPCSGGEKDLVESVTSFN